MNVENSVPSVLNEADLRALGVMTPTMLATKVAQTPAPFVVEGLIYEKTLNLIVGDSGIGKTPLLVTLATAVASGKPFLGRAVNKGPVLYCDAEMTAQDFAALQLSIAKHLGLTEPPENFFLFSLFGDDSPSTNKVETTLKAQIEMIRPALTIVDPLRAFFPRAEETGETSEVFKFQREMLQRFDGAWSNLHHRRKENTKAGYAPDLL